MAFRQIRFHVGDAASVLQRWRATLERAWAIDWRVVHAYAPFVMDVIADARVLQVAAIRLRAGGPKAPGPDGLHLEALSGDEIARLSLALGRALANGSYRPGEEKIRWVPKASGLGRRPIVLMNVEDRVVQKAMALVLGPMLDPLFDPMSFAYRPGRKREHAVAVAVRFAEQGHVHWLMHDLQDAYGRVNLERLLDLFWKRVPCQRLIALLRLVLPPQSPSLTGIKQGGPLSPLALELFLNRFVDQKLHRSGLNVRWARWSDDLLLATRTENVAMKTDQYLRTSLPGSGMLLKDTAEAALHDLRTKDAEWLGFRFRLGDKMQVRLGDKAVGKLGQRLILAHSKSQSAQRAAVVLQSWIGQLGPCHEWEDHASVCRQIRELAISYGFEEIPSEAKLGTWWKEADERWQSARNEKRARVLQASTSPLRPAGPTIIPF